MIQAKNSPTEGAGPRRASDIKGLCLFFVGAATLLWLAMPQSGMLPGFVDHALRLFAGTGAVVIPLILMFVGAMFLLGFERIQFSHSTYGSLLFFLTFVSWRHIGANLSPELAHSVPLGYDPRWSEAHLMASGGYVGAFLGTIILKILGNAVSYMFLILTGSVSAVLVFDRPFLELIKQLKKPAVASVAVTKKGADIAAKTTQKLRGRKPIQDPFEDDDEPAVEKPALPQTAPKKGLALFRRKSAEEIIEDDFPTVVDLQGDDQEIEKRKSAPKGAKFEQISPATKMDQLELNVAAPTPTGFVLPPISLLKESPPAAKRNKGEMAEKIAKIEETLQQFGVNGNVVEIATGPSLTLFEIQLAPGIRVSKIVRLADDLAYALAAIDVRVAPIPGKSAIGVEVPNGKPTMVMLRECIDDPDFWNAPGKLTFCLGKDVSGIHRYADLAKMPHLLVAGSTNSGKSVCLNVIIASILYRATPREVKFLMIDPKRVELSLWDGIPHLMHPVVKDIKMAAGIFRAAIKEMDMRYDLFAKMGTKNIDGYNQKVSEEEKLPYIVIVVDELADLMMQIGPEVEQSIIRIAQLARATGIHLLIATQRPTTNVITGMIKANVPSRIAFAVSSHVDSRTILDLNGAERLIGKGDMLFLPIDAPKPARIQGCYISEQETHSLVDYLKSKERPVYTITAVEIGQSTTSTTGSSPDDEDELFESAVKLAAANGQVSTSMLQRKFKIGYNRAARLVDFMEQRRIVSSQDGSKPRELIMGRDEIERMFQEAYE